MTETSRNARLVGFWYLMLVFIGPLRLIIIPNKLFVTGDAAATAANIAAHQTLFQTGIFVDAWGAVVQVVLAMAFYRLFKDVDRHLARLLVFTGGVLQGAFYIVNTVNDAAALMLIQGDDYLKVFSEAQRQALAFFFIRLHYQLVVSSEVFWGVWLFPMGMLILKSRWFPRFLGWWLFLNGATWLLISFANMFLPEYVEPINTWATPVEFGEIAVTLWFLIMGAKEKTAAA